MLETNLFHKKTKYTGPTSLLLHFEGTHGSQSFIDECGHPFSPTNLGNPLSTCCISTDQKKFGTSSLYVNSQNLYGIQTPDALDLRLDSEFTIEGWFYPLVDPGNTDIFTKGISQDSVLQWYSGSLYVSNPAGAYPLVASTVWTLNEWTHMAISCDGGTVRLFQKGQLLANCPGFQWGMNPGAVFKLGAGRLNGNSFWNGYIDEFRILKGTGAGIYTAPFTPPTAPFSL